MKNTRPENINYLLENEKKYWESRKKEIFSNLNRYMQNRLRDTKILNLPKIYDKSIILEIGCGIWGPIFFIDRGIRIGMDPLIEYYNNEFINKMYNKYVKLIKAEGGILPFDKETIDMVFMDNVLDHCVEPDLVIKEIKRCLKSGGIFIIRQMIFNPFGKCWWEIKTKNGIRDPHHPNIMTKKELINKLKRHGLVLIKSFENNNINKNIKERIKGKKYLILHLKKKQIKL